MLWLLLELLNMTLVMLVSKKKTSFVFVNFVPYFQIVLTHSEQRYVSTTSQQAAAVSLSSVAA